MHLPAGVSAPAGQGLHLWFFGFLHRGDRAKGSQVLVWDHFLTFLNAALETGAALAGLCSLLVSGINKIS